MARLQRFLPSGDDILIICGLVLLGTGLWMVSPSLMFIVCGSLLLGMGLVAAWRKGV